MDVKFRVLVHAKGSVEELPTADEISLGDALFVCAYVSKDIISGPWSPIMGTDSEVHVTIDRDVVKLNIFVYDGDADMAPTAVGIMLVRALSQLLTVLED